MIKQNSNEFADAINEIDFVYNMAPHGARNIVAPRGVSEYSHHHDEDKLSLNGMKGVVAAFSSDEKLPNVFFCSACQWLVCKRRWGISEILASE